MQTAVQNLTAAEAGSGKISSLATCENAHRFRRFDPSAPASNRYDYFETIPIKINIQCWVRYIA